MDITEDFIAQFIGNTPTAANGRRLAFDDAFLSLNRTRDGMLLFGSCKGSGQTPYNCSVDFVEPGKPVPRCTCPSRQTPCKHVAGLLYCRLRGREFAVRELPDDIGEKRVKARRRAGSAMTRPRKESNPTGMTRAKATAAIKKCRAQLAGIDLAEKILRNIVRGGLYSLDNRNRKLYGEGAKELGNYYIPGVQAAFVELLRAAAEGQGEQRYEATIECCGYLYALLKNGRAHTEAKIAAYEAFSRQSDNTFFAPESAIRSTIEEQMGYAWKLAELREHGLYIENAELLQVGFDVIEDEARGEFVDEGLWLCLTDGRVYTTRNHRPFRAQRYIRAEDSFFPILTTPELFIYPGDENPRVRWERSGQRETTPRDLAHATAFAARNFSTVVRAVRTQIKNPLADKNPVFALRVSRLVQDETGKLSILDERGTEISLREEMFGFLLRRLSREQAEGSALICRFAQDAREDRLHAIPVATITANAVLRFTY